MIFEAGISALQTLLSLEHFGYLLLGILMGYVLGILPGLGSIAGVSLLLPFAYDMPPSAALAMMIGVIAPQQTSDTMPAVLMGIPGSAAAQATVMDGFPLAKKGLAARALAAAYTSSIIGGLVGAVVLTFAIFIARPIILSIGFPELMMLVVWSLSMVGAISGKSVLKGMAACVTGLLVGVIGSAPATAEIRLGFGSLYLMEGLQLVVVGMAVFAIPEIVDLLRNSRTIAETRAIGSGWKSGFLDAIRHRWLVLRCSLMGCLLGALPGIGSSVVDWVAYGHAVQSAKDKSEFGKGDIRGVIAPEAANNATLGGSLIPTLLFGIPGSGSMAVLLGGLILIGITPGPSMASTNLNMTFTIIWSLALANVIGGLLCFVSSRPFSQLTNVRYALLAPVMLAIVFFGAYQATQSWGDLISLLALGALGTLLRRFGWSRPAFLIGFVLSGQLEGSVYRAIQIYGLGFFDRPIVIFLCILTVVTIIAAFRMERIDTEVPASAAADPNQSSSRLSQMLFTVAILAFFCVVLYDAAGRTFLSMIFPVVIGIFGLVVVAAVFILQLRGSKRSHILFDSESGSASTETNLHYFLWIGGYAALIAAIGFPVGTAVFILAFTTAKSDASLWVRGAIAVGSMVTILLVTWWLTLPYPRGLLPELLSAFL